MMVEPKALQGKIVHRLLPNFSNGEASSVSRPSSSSSSRKRPRSEPGRNDNDVIGSQQSSSTAAAENISGFIFIPTLRSSCCCNQYPEYVLSLPQDLQKLGCYAAIFNKDVTINRYALFSISVNDSSSSLQIKHLSEDESFGFVEVYEMELAVGNTNILPQNHININTANEKPREDNDYFTLAQFRNKEMYEFEEMQATKNTGRYRIVATVDAISPIINVDPSRPFAMVELYDSESEDESCVVVLKGPEALTSHSCIFPGDKIKFKGLRRKRWQVPETFQRNSKAFSHLIGRVPPYVFVADDIHNVLIAVNQTELLPLTATPIPLVSIQGTIGNLDSVSIKRKGKRYKTIDWVEIIPNKTKSDSSKLKLYVADYPMSTALRLSIRNGAEIRAVNVHPIGWPSQHGGSTCYKSFGACLRSTITIIRHAPADENYDVSSDDGMDYFPYEGPMVCTQPESLPIPLTPTMYSLSLEDFVPFNFCKAIRNTYERHLYYDIVNHFLRNNFQENDASIPTVNKFIGVLHPKVESETWILFSNTSGLGATEEDQDIACASSFLKSPRNTQSTPRNAYAEFFDHAASSHDEPQQASCCNFQGCPMSQKGVFRHIHPPRLHIVGLHKVRSAGLQLLSDRLVTQESSNISIGWNASIHLTEKDLIDHMRREQQELQQNDHSTLFSGGIIKEWKKEGSLPVSLSDKHCCIPSSFTRSSIDHVSDFVVGQVSSVVVACICIATLSEDDCEGFSSKDEETSCQVLREGASLPSSKTREGSCSLLLVQRKLFVAAIHIRFREPISIASTGASPKDDRSRKDKTGGPISDHTVRDYLASPQNLIQSAKNTSSPSRINGLLLRKRYKYPKLESNGLCKGCRLTVSSIPVGRGNDLMSEASCLQSLQVKLSVPVPNGKVDDFKRSLARLSFDGPLTGDQLALGVCWWTVADNGSTSPIVCGGWDDLVIHGSNASDVAVHVSFPTSTISMEKRGFVRVDCRLNEIEATYHESARHRNNRSALTASSTNQITTFDFLSTGKSVFVNGMVCKRVQRRLIFGRNSLRRVGEMIDNRSSEVPTQTFAFLFRRLCRSLKDKDPSIMSPDFVFQLKGAKFLGVGFCQIRCVCTRCYKTLVRIPGHKIEEPSFWHLPNPADMLPVNSQRKQSAIVTELSYPSRRHRAMMRCPNGCPEERFGLQWECSGQLDDGTGQAKLYAERDTALTLLGMDKDTINQIEEGVWHCESGNISFTKTKPPPQRLQNDIKTAISLSIEAQQKRKRGRQNQQQENMNPIPMKFLSPGSRAEYLLHYYCRNSNRPSRRLDYFVKCKPLADNMQHLQHTKEAETYFQETTNGSLRISYAHTYRLPEIQLRLIDSCIATDDDINFLYSHIS